MSKWSAADVPSQSGRVAIVTGANTGIGFHTAEVLAQRGATVVLAVRDVEKGKRAADRIAGTAPGAHLVVQRLDLTSLDSVRQAATDLRDGFDQVDLLINNAGVMYTPKLTTQDGFELQFGTNHLGHFAFTGLLLDRLLATAGSRVVTVSSMAHTIRAKIHFDDLQLTRSYDRIGAYGQSKLANLMFSYELQRRLTAHGGPTLAVAAHPGVSMTELVRNSPLPLRVGSKLLGGLLSQPADQGALPTLRAAVDPAVQGGQYYGPDGFRELRGAPVVVRSSSQSRDADQQLRLWTESERLTGVTFPV
ncbi:MULTISPECIES: SDR family NAD(P)-dependent oxidoreductase [unclassified Crossiella]|uniref:SDR family NAD(P)-dependent oxidoreductase n=1 Tax=unclassified Crossiella TaxID=2620835 RepID=UPI00200030F3|nr:MULTISPECIES: SDR family NAD(P)-dependent oxidoreductase [unclassified Crossiella]MCK2241530.1 SDR family NAD(P)-dependent oxidoreductase [Crossiella sp. S99.2]MCK2255598.1 SDR family NAD(P)-dependent oxidoreductase [Crossiella sp. S99.1]